MVIVVGLVVVVKLVLSVVPFGIVVVICFLVVFFNCRESVVLLRKVGFLVLDVIAVFA